MAFTTTQTVNTVVGNKRFVSGRYANTFGGTGGDIPTGLSTVEGFKLIPTGNVVLPNEGVVNEVFPLSNNLGTVTVVTNTNEVGNWEAWGL